MTMTKGELFQLHEQLCNEALLIMQKKNQDYTGGSEDPFANFRDSLILDIEPELGLMNRMLDKFKRVKSFVALGMFAVAEEGIKDIAHDLINYSVLLTGLMMERHLGRRSEDQEFDMMERDTYDPEKVVVDIIPKGPREPKSNFKAKPIGSVLYHHKTGGKRVYLSKATKDQLETIINSPQYTGAEALAATKELDKRKKGSSKKKKGKTGMRAPLGGLK